MLFRSVVMGRDYWDGLRDQLDSMVERGMIDRRDLDLVLVTDDVDEAVAHVQRAVGDRLVLHPRRRPIRALGESR